VRCKGNLLVQTEPKNGLKTEKVKNGVHRRGRLWDQPHEQDSTRELPLGRLILFSPTRSLLLPWRASPTGNIGSDAANPVVWTPHRLRSSVIPKPMSVCLVVMPPCHHQPALPSWIGELRQKRYKFRQRKLAHLLYVGISLFCTWSRGLVLTLKVHRVQWGPWMIFGLQFWFRSA